MEYEEMDRHRRFTQEDIDRRHRDITSRGDNKGLLDFAHEQIQFDGRKCT